MRLVKYICLVAIIALFALPAFAQEDYAEDLQALLDGYVQPEDPGVVLWVSSPDMDITWGGAAGLADLDAQIPVEVGDSFRIGSITKTFVATIVVQLAEAGTLSLDDPLNHWLPDVAANLSYGDAITLRQLLNMTAGVFSYTESDAFDAAVTDDPPHPWTAAEVVQYVYGEEADFAPGEGWNYSNSNYILLELVINEATGLTLADAMDEYIFAPLGMENSFIEVTPDRFAEGIVHGYADSDDGAFEDETLLNDGVGLGDGGIITTAADLAKFPPALFEGELVGAAWLTEMQTFEVDEEGEGYGLGVSQMKDEFGVELLGHSGATAGFTAEMWYAPEYDLTIVVLTNYIDSEVPSELVLDVVDLLAVGE